MYDAIVVPLDGTPLAEPALAYARTLATPNRGRLILVRAVPPPSLVLGDPTRDGARRLVDARAYLERVKGELGDGIRVETAADVDRPAEAILAAARRFHADLVAMVTHGRSELGTLILGSTAREVLRHGRWPVLLVPSSGTPRPEPRPRHLLVAIAGPKTSTADLAPIGQLARALGAKVTLLRTVSIPAQAADPASRSLYAEVERLAIERTDRLAAELREGGIAAEGVVVVGETARTIVQAAAELGADLIVVPGEVGEKPRGVASSVTATVIRGAEVPVLVETPGSVRR
jgi:nucleotide-binding universal stress UspA family protein